jgi:hypothetical protein
VKRAQPRRTAERQAGWLHRLVYGAALLAVVHFFMQTKADVGEPWAMARSALGSPKAPRICSYVFSMAPGLGNATLRSNSVNRVWLR